MASKGRMDRNLPQNGDIRYAFVSCESPSLEQMFRRAFEAWVVEPGFEVYFGPTKIRVDFGIPKSRR